MRIKVAKVGTQVVDKRTGIVYVVTDNDAATNAEITKAVATEKVDETEDREPRTVTITGENDIMFRIPNGGWVEDTELHSANIVNGILQVDGKDVTMGSIVAKNVLRVFPGTIVFTAEASEDDGRDLVYEYSQSRDKMTILGQMEPTSVVVNSSETRTIYGFSLTKEIEVTDGDQVKKETVFDRAGLYVLTKGHFCFESLTTASLDYDYEDDYDEDEDEYDTDEYDEETAEAEGFLGYDFSAAVMAHGDKYLYIPQIDAEKDVTYKVYRVTNEARYHSSVEMPGKLTEITVNRSSARNLGNVIFSGEGFVKIDDFVIRSNDLAGYVYLVDARRDRVNKTSTYVLATEDCKLKTVVRKTTPDRGDIITFE